MNQGNTANDMLDHDDQPAPKLSSGLNVLSILSFIWCAIQLCFSVWGFFSSQTNFNNKDKVLEQMNSDSMPAWAKSLIPDPARMEEMITKNYENRLPILLLGIVAVALCFVGVLQMRKLKKQGFLFYVIGELLPLLTVYLFIGAFMFSGLQFYIGSGFALLFILLYALQRKNLVY